MAVFLLADTLVSEWAEYQKGTADFLKGTSSFVADFFSQKEKIENFSLLQGTFMGRFSEVCRSKACVLPY